MYGFLFFLSLINVVSLYCQYPHINYNNVTCIAPGGIDDYYSANLRCLNMGGILPTIYDNTTNNIVIQLIKDRLTGPGSWIGIDQRDHWAKGEDITWNNWKTEPTLLPVNESTQCGMIEVNTGQWTRLDCSNRVGFVCQMNGLDPNPNVTCSQTTFGDDKTTGSQDCSPEQHCSHPWRIVTFMALQNETNFNNVIKTLDKQTKTCGKHDEVYYISPSKMNTQIETFKSGYFSNQSKHFGIDESLDYDASDIISEMFQIALANLSSHPLSNRGGLVYIFHDVNCSSTCEASESFAINQSNFIHEMIKEGYSVNIFPLGLDSNETDCIKGAYTQCGLYSKKYCSFQSDGALTEVGVMCVPYHFPLAAIVGISVGVGIILIFVLIILYLRYQFKRHGKYSRFWRAMAGVGMSDIYGTEIDDWEIDKDELEIFIEKELGCGAFAVVYEGKLVGRRPVDEIVPGAMLVADRKEKVAIKRVPTHADKAAKMEFIAEVNFMKKLGYHSHILGMIGCVVAADLPMMVLEFCENGDLLEYVRKCKDDFDVEGNGTLRPKDLLSIAWQISDGLCYLKSLDLIHRDLAARNVLLTKDLIAKISDFGLCRQPEMSDSTTIYVSRGGRLPVKWMAPESLRDFHFSFKTDIWSFGVILWEMYTFGDIPFATCNPTAMLEILESGERLPQGQIPDIIFNIMVHCWARDAEERKDIDQLRAELNEILSSNSQYYGYVAVSNVSMMGADQLEFETDETYNFEYTDDEKF